jgi:hypothetical protein
VGKRKERFVADISTGILGKGGAARVFGQLGCYVTAEIEKSGKRVDQAHWTIEGQAKASAQNRV